ncbi:MAG: Gldg family protein [Bacteroidales bacterium]|nr:Gldg family protein [Bacteroidales bacterium]
MKTKNSVTYYILGILIVLVLINVISDKFFLRLDFTEDNRYTLSRATKDILKSLNDPVTITAYFSVDLPPDIAKTRRDFKELLIEYSNSSYGMLVYEFVNPNEDEETEREAAMAGVQPVIINIREKDQVKQQKAFLGAVIQIGEETDVIPFMQPGAAMEYALSSSIKKISVIDKPVIGFLQGHSEPSIRSYQQVYSQLSVLYNIEPVSLTDSTNELSKYKTVAIVAPKDSFPDNHLKQLDEYLNSGGKLFIAYNRVDGDLSKATGSSLTTGMETWLTKKGIVIEDNFIIDANCASVGVRQQQGMFSFNTQVQFPYIPIITNFEDHPVTKGLETVILQFVSTISFTGDSTVSFTPLAKTSKKSGTQSSPLYFDISKQWTEVDFPLSNLIVAAHVKGELAGKNNSEMIIISDGNFPVNGEGQAAQQLQEDNVSLMVNSIDFLSDDTGLIELRTKGVTSRPLDQIEDSTKSVLKYLNFLLPIILIIIYGIFRMQVKRNIRIKRMEEGYV